MQYDESLPMPPEIHEAWPPAIAVPAPDFDEFVQDPFIG